MQTATTVLMGIALAADACAVSLTSGCLIRNIKINKALKIALFFGIFQALMICLGWLMGLTFREFIISFSHWVAFGLLSLLGTKMIYEACKSAENDEKFNPLDTYTLTGLAIATSLDALAAGIGLSLMKSSIIFSASIVGLITFWACFIAVFIGHKFGDLFGDKMEIVAGVVLIAIGSKILIENLV